MTIERWRRLRISPRQAQILNLIAQGRTDKEIARHLGLSTSTVRSHLERCYRDNQFRSRSEAAALWSVRAHAAQALSRG
jgi:DNA-binding CsgD family transcriptional regulator